MKTIINPVKLYILIFIWNNSFHFPANTRTRRCLETLPRTLTGLTPGPGDPRSPARIGDGAGAGTETGEGGTRGIGDTLQPAVTQVLYLGIICFVGPCSEPEPIRFELWQTKEEEGQGKGERKARGWETRWNREEENCRGQTEGDWG